MIEIPITKLCGYEEAKPRNALVESLKDQGFLPAFPIVVAPQSNGVYRILDGRRRTAAAAKAGLEVVLAVVVEGGAAFTILAHATRSENPVAELRAYQELMRAGMSEEQIARAGYASLQRIRRIAKLNRLIPEIAGRVESGEVAPGVAFEIARLSPDAQQALAKEEKIAGPVVQGHRQTQRQDAKLSVPGLEDLFETPQQASIEDVFSMLSNETLSAILAEMPVDSRFTTWRAKVRQIISARAIPQPVTIPAERVNA
jgi:ParB/RepB/Spo0J family partition protein